MCFSKLVSASFVASNSRIFRRSSIRFVSRIRSLAVNSSISRDVPPRVSRVDGTSRLDLSGDSERIRWRNEGGERFTGESLR